MMLKPGVAKPGRRQIWPWNGCGITFACGEALLSLLLLLLPLLLPLAGWLAAAVVAGNRLVVPPPLPPPPQPPPSPPTPPPQPPASLHLTRYRSHGVAGDERDDYLAKCHRFQGIFTFCAHEVCFTPSSLSPTHLSRRRAVSTLQFYQLFCIYILLCLHLDAIYCLAPSDSISSLRARLHISTNSLLQSSLMISCFLYFLYLSYIYIYWPMSLLSFYFSLANATMSFFIYKRNSYIFLRV